MVTQRRPLAPTRPSLNSTFSDPQPSIWRQPKIVWCCLRVSGILVWPGLVSLVPGAGRPGWMAVDQQTAPMLPMVSAVWYFLTDICHILACKLTWWCHTDLLTWKVISKGSFWDTLRKAFVTCYICVLIEWHKIQCECSAEKTWHSYAVCSCHTIY